MKLLGIEASQVEAAGGLWTAREILQQPVVWPAIGTLLAGEAAALDSFLKPLLARADLRIVLTGAGTSAFVGEALAPALKRRTRCRIDAVATTDLIAAPAEFLDPQCPTLVVSFARSGNSPESVAAMTLASGYVADCHHLVITCNAEGQLYRAAARQPSARTVLLPDATHDRGFAMTSSFTGMLLTAALAFDVLQPAAVKDLAAWTSSMLDAGLPLITALAELSPERVVYLGAREFKGLAREAALKLLELSDGRVVALAETPLGFRHGPKTIVNARTVVVVFLSNEPHSRRYELDLLAELRRDGIAMRVVALRAGAAAGGVALPDAVDFPVDGAQHASELELCFPYIVFAQAIAFLQSMKLGLRPDVPNAGGVVSRVVQGVSIHPWAAPG